MEKVSRREFMKFCSAVAATLMLPVDLVAKTLEKIKKPVLVWMEFQSCTGDTESLLRASRPTAADLVLDILSVNYHETIMAAAGKQAEEALVQTILEEKGKYIAVVEGSIPTKEGGAYCVIGGRSALSRVQEVCKDASAVLAVGTCAAFGGLPAAKPNPTGAVSVSDVVAGVPIVNLPGCPVNAVNLTAAVVHLLTFGSLPELDRLKRPLFAYGKKIHDTCERRAHFDAGNFVEKWGDEGHRKGWCLYKMGCKGPSAFMNCPTVRWNEGTSWPVGSGHPCLGCGVPNFWDEMTPFYERLPNVSLPGVEADADTVGIAAVGAVAAVTAVHAVGKYLEGRKK